jgi:hypothetical protein
MEENRNKAPADGPDGIDAWAGNGYGLMLDDKPMKPWDEKETPKKDTEEIEEV